MRTKKSEDVVYIHRGRNPGCVEIGRLFTRSDYNFDYRGTSKILLLLKALITSTEIPRSKIYFVEGGLCMNVAMFVKRIRCPKSRIILMVVEPLFDLDGAPSWKKRYVRWLVSHADGIITISNMVRDDARKYYSGPLEVGNFYIRNLDSLLACDADVHSHRMVFVVERPKETGRVKGLDVVVEAYRMIKTEVPDAELLLIGAGTETLTYDDPSIKCLGFVNIMDVFKRCSVILSPARYDAFPLAVAEAAATGLIPIISSRVGSKEYVAKVYAGLVVDSLDPKKYADAVLDVWRMKPKAREALAERLKDEARVLNKERIQKIYLDAWRTLVDSHPRKQ